MSGRNKSYFRTMFFLSGHTGKIKTESTNILYQGLSRPPIPCRPSAQSFPRTLAVLSPLPTRHPEDDLPQLLPGCNHSGKWVTPQHGAKAGSLKPGSRGRHQMLHNRRLHFQEVFGKLGGMKSSRFLSHLMSHSAEEHGTSGLGVQRVC